MSSGKSSGQARTDIDSMGPPTAAVSFVERGRRCPHDRCVYLGHQLGQRVVVERVARAVHEMRSALVMDRRGRKPGLDQLDPAAVDDGVVGRGGNRDRPAVVMCDPEPHCRILPQFERAPATRSMISAVDTTSTPIPRISASPRS